MSVPRVTLRDVAEAANVSLTAVSFYLNNKPGLSDATRTRIAEVVEQLGYVPRSSGAGVTLSFIGLLIERLPLSPFADMFYGDVIQGIESQARSLGYNVALMTVEGSASLPTLFEQHSGSLAGVVILGGGDISAQTIESVLQEGLPSVLVDSDTRNSTIHSVMPDYVHGAYEATQYLIDKGYQRIAFIHGSAKYRSLVERFHGYTCALVDAGIAIDPRLIQPSISSGVPNKGYREMKALLERGVPFDAVFCVSDRTALGALDALREAHVRIPDDVALIGFDNVAQSSHTSPPLTTVDVYKREMGAAAIDVLHRQITSPNERFVVKTITPTQLIVRNST
ncbi:MAG: LacI family DNA-binding transcriptional regulator [Chloroflexota bacterium]